MLNKLMLCLVFYFGVQKLLDASAANIGSNSLTLNASIFTLSTDMGIIVNSALCRKIRNVNINFLLLTVTANRDSIAGNETTLD